MSTKISILMSVYNGAKTLNDSIESILSQSFSNFEFLILDDASVDETYEIMNKYQKLDNRIKLFKHKENLGLTKSLNFLLSISKGKYIARQDADDVSDSERINIQYAFLEKTDYEICYTRALNTYSNFKIPGISFYLPHKAIIKFKNPFIHGTLMIDKKLLLNFGGYNEKFYYAQDYKLAYDLIQNNIKIKNINKVLYHLNTKNNISTKFIEKQKYFAECVKKNINPENNFMI